MLVDESKALSANPWHKHDLYICNWSCAGEKLATATGAMYRGGRPRLIIHEYAVTFSGRGFGRVAEVAETQVLEARLACEGRLWMNHRENHEVWTLLD